MASARDVAVAPAQAFELFPGADVAAGRYRWDRVVLDVTSSGARPDGRGQNAPIRVTLSASVRSLRSPVLVSSRSVYTRNTSLSGR